MSNEIQAAVSLFASKNGASLARSISKVFDMSGDDLGSGTQEIGTSDEQLVLPADIGTGKLLLIENLSGANYVEFSYGTGGSFSAVVRIDPNGFSFFRPTSLTIYLKANTNPCRVQWSIVEA
jgi:hypothetical protein